MQQINANQFLNPLERVKCMLRKIQRKLGETYQLEGKHGVASNVKTWTAGRATVRTHPSEGVGWQPVLGMATSAVTVHSIDGPLLRSAHLCAELL